MERCRVTAAILVGALLHCGSRPELRRYAAWLAGLLFFLLNPFEPWLSGDSIDLARSFGPAVFTHGWHGFRIYVVGPFCGVLVVVAMIRAEMFGKVHLHEARRAYFGHGGRVFYFLHWPRFLKRF